MCTPEEVAKAAGDEARHWLGSPHRRRQHGGSIPAPTAGAPGGRAPWTVVVANCGLRLPERRRSGPRRGEARRGEAARGCTRASPFLFFSLDPETGIDLDEFATELAELT